MTKWFATSRSKVEITNHIKINRYKEREGSRDTKTGGNGRERDKLKIEAERRKRSQSAKHTRKKTECRALEEVQGEKATRPFFPSPLTHSCVFF